MPLLINIKTFALILALGMVTSGCVAMPKPPSTPLCLFTNVHTNKDAPELLGKLLEPKDMYFRCTNAKGTKYNISVSSPSADKIVGTPYVDYVELMAYYNKLAEVFKKEFLNKVGR